MKKITFSSEQQGKHYTIRFWDNRKCLDVHVTDERADADKYKQIVEVRYFTIYRWLIEMNRNIESLSKKYLFNNRISIGKLMRLNCVLLPNTPNNNELSDIMSISEKRLRFRKGFDPSHLEKFLLSPNELKDDKQVAFFVFRPENRLKYFGIIYRLRKPTAPTEFLFISERQYHRFAMLLQCTMPDSCRSIADALLDASKPRIMEQSFGF